MNLKFRILPINTLKLSTRSSVQSLDTIRPLSVTEGFEKRALKLNFLPDEFLSVVPSTAFSLSLSTYFIVGGIPVFRALKSINSDLPVPCFIVEKPIEMALRIIHESELFNSLTSRLIGQMIVEFIGANADLTGELNLSRLQKSSIAQISGYENQELKSIYRAVTSLRAIYFSSSLNHEEGTAERSFRSVMIEHIDRATYPELNEFLLTGIPYRFYRKFNERRMKQQTLEYTAVGK